MEIWILRKLAEMSRLELGQSLRRVSCEIADSTTPPIISRENIQATRDTLQTLHSTVIRTQISEMTSIEEYAPVV
jgi:predicted acyltransferase (DUF342 family)